MATTYMTHWKWAGLTAFGWFFGWILLLAALRPEYRNATKAISELGAVGAPHMLLMDLFGFAGTGVLLGLFASSYRSRMGKTAPGYRALMLTAVLFALTAFPLEIGASGNPDMTSKMTQVHFFFVLLVPLPWLWAAIQITGFARRAGQRGLSIASGVAVAGLLTLTALSIARSVPHAPGLLQRATFAIFLGWYGVADLLLRGVPFARAE
jgi:hypothetical protein